MPVLSMRAHLVWFTLIARWVELLVRRLHYKACLFRDIMLFWTMGVPVYILGSVFTGVCSLLWAISL